MANQYMNYFHKQIKNTPVRRRHNQTRPWWLYISIVLGFTIAYGFIMAARYHFNAVELGYQTEELKRQRAKLEQCQRKLELELARRTAPQRLDKRARQQGLELPSGRQTLLLRRTKAANADQQ
ncbi:MAG: hypothetical protein AB1489_04980 [Acidobacteriota bacterium]